MERGQSLGIFVLSSLPRFKFILSPLFFDIRIFSERDELIFFSSQAPLSWMVSG